MKFRCLAAFMVAITFPPLTTTSGAWNDPTNAQYHIQTDEGPERYFRYQTQSGQYRKEKRLEDGTVIGTYAWIDSDGMLRLRDYIADNAGYRILRSKNLYVGTNSPIDQAIKAAKKAPVTGGVLATPSQGGKTPIINFHYRAPQVSVPPQVSIPQVQISPNSYLPAHVTTLITTTPSPLNRQSETIVHIPSTTPLNVPLESTTPSPIHSTNQPGEYETSTPSNVYVPQPAVSSPLPPLSSAYLPQPIAPSTPPPLSSAYLPQQSSPSPPLSSNSVEYPNTPGYSGAPQYEHYTDNFVNPYIYQNGPTYPIDKNGHTFNGHTNKIGNGYNSQYPQYDGVSVTNDGFRYYIPRAYHEEQNFPGERKSGSFGYIDPFGIRRVVYYNAGPGTGFQHRKNNRYVGFDATPYDPRPY